MLEKLKNNQFISLLPIILLAVLLYFVNMFSSSFRPDAQVVSSSPRDFQQLADLVIGAVEFLQIVFLGLFVFCGFIIGAANKVSLNLNFVVIFISFAFLFLQVSGAGMLFGIRTELINISRLTPPDGDYLLTMLRWLGVVVFFSFTSLVCGALEIFRQFGLEE